MEPKICRPGPTGPWAGYAPVRDQGITLCRFLNAKTILIKLTLLFFSFPDQAPFDPNAKADKFFINVEVCYVIAQ